jgi:hypothetical protein
MYVHFNRFLRHRHIYLQVLSFTTTPLSSLDFHASFVYTSPSGVTKTAAIVDFTRTNHLRDTTFVSSRAGLLTLEWSNHFSLFKSKYVTLKIRTLDGSEKEIAAQNYVEERESLQLWKDLKVREVCQKCNLGKSFRAEVRGHIERTDIFAHRYCAFIIRCSWRGNELQKYSWKLAGRYSSFRDLYYILLKKFPADSLQLPPFPKKFLNRPSEELVRVREKELNRWLQAVIISPVLLGSSETIDFLKIHVNIGRARATALEKINFDGATSNYAVAEDGYFGSTYGSGSNSNRSSPVKSADCSIELDPLIDLKN